LAFVGDDGKEEGEFFHGWTQMNTDQEDLVN
jgi:hypothetical protein